MGIHISWSGVLATWTLHWVTEHIIQHLILTYDMLGCTCNWSYSISTVLVESATTCTWHAGRQGITALKFTCAMPFHLLVTHYINIWLTPLWKITVHITSYMLCFIQTLFLLSFIWQHIMEVTQHGVASDSWAAWEVQPLFIPTWQCSDDGLHTFHPYDGVSWQHPRLGQL